MSAADVYVRPRGVAALQDRTIRSSQRFNDVFERITTCWVDAAVKCGELSDHRSETQVTDHRQIASA